MTREELNIFLDKACEFLEENLEYDYDANSLITKFYSRDDDFLEDFRKEMIEYYEQFRQESRKGDKIAPSHTER